MDLKNSDACDGRANQFGVFLGILAMLVGGFFFIQQLVAIVTFAAFGFALEGAILDGIIVMFITVVFAIFNQNFWVNVKGNNAQAAINIFSPKTLSNGGTRYIVFGPGIALKFPWIVLDGKSIEIERQKVIDCKPFEVTIGNTSLKIEMKIAWKPHNHFLSSYLQNATKDGGEKEIEKQFVAKAKQLVETYASKMGGSEEAKPERADYVRKNQGVLLRRPVYQDQSGYQHLDLDEDCLFAELYKFGEWIGFELVDVSFESCDFDPEVQKRMNQIKESEKVLEIQNKIMEGSKPGDGMTRDKAAELAAVYCGISGVKINRQIVEGLDLSALGGLGKEILKKIGGEK